MADLPLFGELSIFWVGALGSISIEMAAAAKSCAELEGQCPERYKRPFYLFTRVLMAAVAGAVASVLDAQNGLTAFYMGASAPLILDRLGKGLDVNGAPQHALAPPAGQAASSNE